MPQLHGQHLLYFDTSILKASLPVLSSSNAARTLLFHGDVPEGHFLLHAHRSSPSEVQHPRKHRLPGLQAMAFPSSLSVSVSPSFSLFPIRVFGSLGLFPRSRSLDLSSFHSCQTHTSLPSRKLPLTQLNQPLRVGGLAASQHKQLPQTLTPCFITPVCLYRAITIKGSATGGPALPLIRLGIPRICTEGPCS